MKRMSIDEAARLAWEQKGDKDGVVEFNDIVIRPGATIEDMIQGYYTRRAEVKSLYEQLLQANPGDTESAIVRHFVELRQQASPGSEAQELWWQFHEVLSYHFDRQKEKLVDELVRNEGHRLPPVVDDVFYCFRRS